MSAARPGPFFRGGELRGLVIFAVVMAVGWPVILNYARPRGRPAPMPAVDPRPIMPDDGMAFRGLLDKTPMAFRDNAAYKALLDRARATPAATLARDARRDVFYTHLWERPDRYRGVPLHLEGTLLKALPHREINPELSPKGTLVEAWFSTADSRPLPYVVMLEDPPPGLPVGADLNERVVVDGYFLRLLGYRAGDAYRAAPLLVGRLRWASADPASGVPASAPVAGKGRWGVPIVAIVASLAVYVAIRLFFQVRRFTVPTARRPSLLASDRPSEQIAPEALADWLASIPDEGDRPDRDHPGPPSP